MPAGHPRAEVDEERRFQLVNLVETYLHLTGREAERYAELVTLEANEEVQEMELTWAGRIQHENYELGHEQGHAKGLEQGRKQGLEQGRKQGLEQGRIQGVRQVTLGLLGKRFGALPSAAVRKVEAMDTAALHELTQRLLEAETLDGLGLD